MQNELYLKLGDPNLKVNQMIVAYDSGSLQQHKTFDGEVF